MEEQRVDEMGNAHARQYNTDGSRSKGNWAEVMTLVTEIIELKEEEERIE